MKSYIELENVKKTYIVGEQKFNALDGIDLNIDQGEFVVVLGPSGAGKSTLLNLLGGMDKVTSWKIIIDNEVISKYTDKELTKYRANDVGFIFQFYNIMPTLTVLENVELVKDDERITTSVNVIDSGDYIRFINADDEFIKLDSKDGIYLTRLLAEKNNYKVGDKVKWHIFGSDTYYESTLIGLNKEPQIQTMTMTKDYYESLGLIYKADYLY